MLRPVTASLMGAWALPSAANAHGGSRFQRRRPDGRRVPFAILVERQRRLDQGHEGRLLAAGLVPFRQVDLDLGQVQEIDHGVDVGQSPGPLLDERGYRRPTARSTTRSPVPRTRPGKVSANM